MSTSAKNPNENPKKSSFWERLSEKQSSEEGSSLVNAIVKQAEKEASGSGKHNSALNSLKAESERKERAHMMLANAKTVLGFVIIAIISVWLYFFAMLHESNYFHAKIGKENLTTELNRKAAILDQILTDKRDTIKFSKLLRVENLANQVLVIDIDDPVLNYERPQGEKVTPRDDSAEILIKTVNLDGSVVYHAETEIRSLEDARDIRIEKIRSALMEISKTAEELQTAIKSDPEIEENLTALTNEITTIDVEEKDFPSAPLKNHLATAQSLAKEILRKVKKINLDNLVTDIKKQVQAIDTTGTGVQTKEIVVGLQASLNRISAQQPSSLITALNETKVINVKNIPENEIYQKIIRIIGDPQDEKNNSDLSTASTIAPNLDRINTIDDIRKGRIPWSNVIEQTDKIVRLGADLKRDTEGTPLDSRRDIDPDGQLVSLSSYTGKSAKGEIEISGEVFGEANYDKKSFTLLSDLIDAFESSKDFQDVSGFSFSKSEDRQGRILSPLSLKLTLQDPAVFDSRDINQTEEKKVKSDTIQTEIKNIDVEAVKEIDFSFSGKSKTEDIQAANTESNLDEHKRASAGEFIDAFEALHIILNN
ncbi:hypothetical protein K9N08_01175 [Candidatus Gracilibacteria bacterium]|nr:hypothetical protein [Candidatus Gracilibacteria bacterium]MCF7856154.1 hypothetical protein [Candidatus Gracilibacteria bacterium]MCF7896620.1 hypothetical protein [Candidatus Gracilibacteria bacterium]